MLWVKCDQCGGLVPENSTIWHDEKEICVYCQEKIGLEPLHEKQMRTIQESNVWIERTED